MELTAEQARAVALLVAGESLADAAKRLRVSERTLRRWRATPAMQAALRAAGEDAMQLARDALLAATGDAVDTIVEVMTDRGAPAVARIRAAEAVLARTGLLAGTAVKIEGGRDVRDLSDEELVGLMRDAVARHDGQAPGGPTDEPDDQDDGEDGLDPEDVGRDEPEAEPGPKPRPGWE